MEWKLDDVLATRARNLQPLLHRPGETNPERAHCLELLTSALFLFKTEQARSRATQKAHPRFSRNNGKDFDAREVKAAVKELKAYGLLG